jgi:hypothetical protein
VIGCAEVAGLVMVLRLTAESYMAAKTHGVGPMKVVTILMISIGGVRGTGVRGTYNLTPHLSGVQYWKD